MVHALELIFSLGLIQSLLRCLYFWQLKEYRWDRFREWLSTREAGQYFWPSWRFFRPKLTFKVLVLGLIGFYLSILVIDNFPDQPLAPLAAFGLVPVSVSLAVAILAPISALVKQLIVVAARIKLRLWHRSLIVVGITGSYGKTSTKEILSHILAAKYRVYKTPQTVNTLIGIAGTVIKMPRATQVLVAELGAYRLGEIAAIGRLIRPRIGIITGINQQHLGLFGSQENIVAAKSELLKCLPATGLAIVNGTNSFARQAAKSSQAPVEYYGPSRLKTNLLGRHQQLNLAGALAAAKALKLKPRNGNLLQIPNFKTAITRVTGLNSALIIKDSYNSNSAGFLAALDLVKQERNRHKILLFNGIIELGEVSGSVHRDLARSAEPVFKRIFTAKQEVLRYFKADYFSESKLLLQLKQILSKNYLVLIEGRFSDKFIKILCQNQS